MINYHAVLLDECNTEFGHSFRAASRADARDYLRDAFPESRVVQLEDAHEAAAREARIYALASADSCDDL